MINLIDQEGKFNERLSEFPNATANIAIFGSQSSGKSTLLNSAFKTSFPVLDTRQGRNRCTKGVWLQDAGKFNIIDTEGFDSVERTKDERIYERQIALFCLAIADVVIVNLWMNEIGRYQGAQIHILRAIISASSSLLESQSKVLMFVVKDCTQDADQDILKQQLENQVNKIISEMPSKTSKPPKFSLEFYFMSHYIYRPEQYEKQAAKLPALLRVKRSSLAKYQPNDRMVYMVHLWEKIKAGDGDIDLRVEEEALRTFVVNRIREEVKTKVEDKIRQQGHIGRLNSYERFYQFYVKKSFEEIKAKLPKFVDEKTIKRQFYILEEELQYVIQKHFTQVILPKQQEKILSEELDKQLKKSCNSNKLEKIINELRKKALQTYKLLVQGHKQSTILTKRFAERITEYSVIYQRQVSHLFNIFETRLQSEINKELDKQIKKLKFEGSTISDKFKSLCKQFSYNEWEVTTKEIWEKVSYRALSQRLLAKIEDVSGAMNYTVFAPAKEAEIISEHKDLEKKAEAFVHELLEYFEQDNTGEQYIEKSKQKIRACLEAALIREKKRFRLSMLILGIFLILFWGEFLLILKTLGVKKRTRKSISTFYSIAAMVMIAGSILKRVIQASQQSQSAREEDALW